MDKLRMGVLGCSGHYSLRVSTPLKSSLLIEPYAVASRDAAKAKKYAKTWGFEKSYGSYEDLLSDPNVDFVYIPLPNHLHLQYIKKAADAGKAILCEKPLCLNAKEAAQAASYCQKKKVPLMEAFMYRFHPQWIRAYEIARSGELGEVMGTGGVFSYDNKDPSNIRNIASAGGGALLDIGCYTVSSARYLMGAEPKKVVANALRDSAFKTDTYVSAILDFGNGKSSTFTIGTQIFPYQRVTAYGTGGDLSIDVPFNMYGDVPGVVTVSQGVGTRVIQTEIADQYLLEFDSFAQALIEKTEVPTPIQDAINNMAVIDALFASASSGKWEAVAKL
ncbi:Gfo/Idh/MocA family protein [Leadbettera azotonutricia]|uniref:Oxidoreductase n=1 Tax=Leadbettera azotonutricia (strain ATCC BAA-888 / DSM 13862 / ZAS-9) TaxID=545695 RepID=F5YEQ3_LEAAZ|nr:Gfo/Idh/MocA family oxidoreductase [Leadbettera azotonutricia]AEF82196.1 oxidoreductase [Leadbettera azotonutricia ZAS-9]